MSTYPDLPQQDEMTFSDISKQPDSKAIATVPDTEQNFWSQCKFLGEKQMKKKNVLPEITAATKSTQTIATGDIVYFSKVFTGNLVEDGGLLPQQILFKENQHGRLVAKCIVLLLCMHLT